MNLLAKALDGFSGITKWEIGNPHVTWLDEGSAVVLYTRMGTGTFEGRPMAPMAPASTVWAKRNGNGSRLITKRLTSQGSDRTAARSAGWVTKGPTSTCPLSGVTYVGTGMRDRAGDDPSASCLSRATEPRRGVCALTCVANDPTAARSTSRSQVDQPENAAGQRLRPRTGDGVAGVEDADKIERDRLHVSRRDPLHRNALVTSTPRRRRR
jgi:hypothetical protein